MQFYGQPAIDDDNIAGYNEHTEYRAAQHTVYIGAANCDEDNKKKIYIKKYK